jgi:hypothetical protein
MNITKRLAMLLGILFSTAALAAPEYVVTRMEVDIAKPASVAWAKVGKMCDLKEWFGLDCTVTSGDGGVGTVRSLLGGRVTEIIIGTTELSYGYTQPIKEGQFYNLYHGFMEAKPVTAKTSKIIYTLLYDVSDKPDQAAKDADVAQRRARFEAALQKMKSIAEAK